MKSTKAKKKLVIVGVHQSYAKTYAGGYVRLREFLKNIPATFDYHILDTKPTIYADVVSRKNITILTVPNYILFALKVAFPLGVFLERIWTAFALYKLLKKTCDDQKGELLVYIPIGELLHLYLPAIFLKRKYPNVRIVADILNFEVYYEGFFSLVKRFQKSSSLISSYILALVHYISFLVTKKTITTVDYIFTVSPELVTVIKKIYPRKTIDFTPSGVHVESKYLRKRSKKYLGVYVGRVTEQKGIYNLLSVWHEVVAVFPSAKLAIAGLIGPDVSAEVTKLIDEYSLKDNITIFGAVTEKKKYELISQSELFLHLATYEPLFPVIGILEGCALGLPVVVYNMSVVSSQPELKKEKSISIVRNGNIKETVKTILRLSKLSIKDKQKLSISAKKYAQRYNWKIIAKKEWKVIDAFI